ncbi:hypothetical protein BH09DEP1_BH09DEP1_8200 [soil metagenome]
MLKIVMFYFSCSLIFPMLGSQEPVKFYNDAPISFAIPAHYYFSLLHSDLLQMLKNYLHPLLIGQVPDKNRSVLELLSLWPWKEVKKSDITILFQRSYLKNEWNAALFLIAQGASPNSKAQVPHSPTPLMQAVQDNNGTAARALIQAGAWLPDATTNFFYHPLHHTAEKNFSAMAQLLLDAGVKYHSQGGKIKKKLILIAVQYGSLETLQVFLAHGAKEEPKDLNKWWKDALYWGRASIITFLLQKKGMLPNERRYDGTCDYPLEEVVKRGHVEATKVLLVAGADPNKTSETGIASTPLYHATKNGDPEIVKLLLESGALPDFEEGNAHPLFIAGYKNYQKVAEILLHYCKRIDPADDALESPLEVAISFHSYKVAKMLLDAGANPNRVSKRRIGALGNCIRELTMSWNPDQKEDYKEMLVATLEKMHHGPYARPHLMKYLEDWHEKWCDCSKPSSKHTSSCILYNYLPYLKRKFND